ncbi:MAG: hypothetical protein FWD71_01365 [Oscillospiraceae bacterium]|nr:hypothetical protein [Oscillospiraceae bacterium]
MSEIIIFDKQIADLLQELRLRGTEIQVEADEEISGFIDDTFIPTLKYNSPASAKEKKNKYRDGWIKKKDGKSKYFRVSNKNRPDMTYMLEYGFERTYKNKSGKPTKIFRAGARPHIRPTVEQTESVLINRLKNKLGGN